MKLLAARYAEAVGDPAGRRNVTLGVIQHLWRSPVPFIGFYPPEGAKVTGNRFYIPTPPRLVDDVDYLAGVEAHKRAFARDLQKAMISGGNLPGYFEVPTDEGWKLALDLPGKKLDLSDGWGLSSGCEIKGDLAPFVWAFRNTNFCIITIYDKDIQSVRDDLLFVATREGLELRWRRPAA